MALVKRGKVWWIDLHVAHGDGDNRYRASTRTGDRKVAEVLHGEAMRKLLLGVEMAAPVSPRSTLGGAFDKALRMDLKGVKSERTIGFHRQAIYAAIGPTTTLAALGDTHVEALVSALRAKGNGNATINRTCQTLGRVLRIAGVTPPRFPNLDEGAGRTRTFSEAEEADILAYWRTHTAWMGDLTVILLDTGMRLGELMAQDRMRLFPGKVTLCDTKGGGARTVPLTARADAALARWVDSPPARTKDQVEWRWRQMRLALFPGDKEAVIHTLRHTCATRLIARGYPMAKVMLWLGHKDFKTTMRYTNLVSEDLKDGVALLENVTAPVTAPVT
jgi:integrase